MKNHLFVVVAAVVVVACILMGCQKEASPVSGPEVTNASTPNFLKLPATSRSLGKWVLTDGLITVKDGGTIILQYTEDNPATGKKGLNLNAQLLFEPNSVTNDFQASISMDATYLMNSVSLEFGPHGTTFLKPATLTISVDGLDLSAYSSRDNFHLYYDDNGLWTKMDGSVKVWLERGALSCQDGKLPHFSRYGFARADDEAPAP